MLPSKVLQELGAFLKDVWVWGRQSCWSCSYFVLCFFDTMPIYSVCWFSFKTSYISMSLFLSHKGLIQKGNMCKYKLWKCVDLDSLLVCTTCWRQIMLRKIIPNFSVFYLFPLIFVSKLLKRPSCKYAIFLKESVNNMHVHVFYFISNCGNDILDLIKMKFEMFEMKLESSWTLSQTYFIHNQSCYCVLPCIQQLPFHPLST